MNDTELIAIRYAIAGCKARPLARQNAARVIKLFENRCVCPEVDLEVRSKEIVFRFPPRDTSQLVVIVGAKNVRCILVELTDTGSHVGGSLAAKINAAKSDSTILAFLDGYMEYGMEHVAKFLGELWPPEKLK